MALREEILYIVRESPDGARNADICRKLGLDPSKFAPKIRYHLRELEKMKLVGKEEGKYYLANVYKKFIRIGKEIKLKLAEKGKEDEEKNIPQEARGYSIEELKNEFSDKNFLVFAINELQRGGFIEGKWIVNNYTKKRDDKNRYVLSPLGYSSINKCPVCKKDLENSDSLLTGILRIEPSISKQDPDFRTVFVHTECSVSSGLLGENVGRRGKGALCEHCGLPLSPKLLPKSKVNCLSIKEYFYEIELGKLIDFLDYVSRTCHRPLTDILATAPSEMAHPFGEDKILDLKSLKEESIPEAMNARGEELNEAITILLRANLTMKEHSKEFVKTFSKIWTELPKNFDLEETTNEVWKVAKLSRAEEEEKVQKLYKDLLGPGGLLQAEMDRSSKMEEYVKRGLKTKKILGMEKSLFTQTISSKRNGKTYHPYCAEKIERGNESHQDDKNEKGVKIKWQKTAQTTRGRTQ